MRACAQKPHSRCDRFRGFPPFYSVNANVHWATLKGQTPSWRPLSRRKGLHCAFQPNATANNLIALIELINIHANIFPWIPLIIYQSEELRRNFTLTGFQNQPYLKLYLNPYLALKKGNAFCYFFICYSVTWTSHQLVCWSMYLSCMCKHPVSPPSPFLLGK